MKTVIIEICVGTFCHLKGSQQLFDAVEALPTARREWIDLRGIACLKSCREGPSVRVDGAVLPNMTPERLLATIEGVFVKKGPRVNKVTKIRNEIRSGGG
jgi:NADH:ubiquinone oxidoreductase subunit E